MTRPWKNETEKDLFCNFNPLVDILEYQPLCMTIPVIKHCSDNKIFKIRMPNYTSTPLCGERTLKYSSLNHGVKISHNN